MIAWPACDTCLVAVVVVAAILAVILLAVLWQAAPSRIGLAERADANGRALLTLADALEAHADDLERIGIPARSQRA